MATQITTALLSAVLAMTSCTSFHRNDVQCPLVVSNHGASEGKTFAFDFASDGERKRAEKLALQGDPVSADRLSRYYAVIKRNRTETGRWDMIAVLNGSVSAQISMASQLYRMQNEEAWSYAKALLERASERGDKRAAQMLSHHSEQVEAWRKLRDQDKEQLRRLGYRGSLLSDP